MFEDGAFRIDAMEPYPLGSLTSLVHDARESGKDIIDLSQLNPSQGAPGVAVESLIQAALKPAQHRYSSSAGIRRLRETISTWYERHFKKSFSSDSQVVVTIGTKEGLSHLLLALLHPGDAVLLPSPGYPVHRAAVFIAGGKCIDVLLPRENVLSEKSDEFFLNVAECYQQASSRPRVMILSFPHNPTTTVVTTGFFERLVDFAREQKLILVHDFAYAGFCYDNFSAPSLLQVKGAEEVAVEFFSLSKTYSMPGWRVAFCLGNEALISRLKKIKSYLDFGIFQPLQIAAVKVLASGDDFRRELVLSYQSRRDVLCDGLQSAGFSFIKPQASPFVWAEIPELFRAQGSMAFCKMLLEQAQVAVSPGVGFGLAGEGFVRLSLGENEQRLQKAGQAMAAVLKRAGE